MIRAKDGTSRWTREERTGTRPSPSTPKPGHPGEALVFATPGRRYRIEDVPFDAAREICDALGCGEGSEVVCVDNDLTGVSVFLTDGRRKFIGREYAWFVKAIEIGLAPRSVSPDLAMARPLPRIA